MKVTIKNFDVAVEVKNKGIEFDVRSSDGKERYGDVILTKMGLIWCEGKTTREKGKKVSWDQFRAWINS